MPSHKEWTEQMYQPPFEISPHDPPTLIEAINHINVGICICDAENRLVWWNNAYQEFWSALSDRITMGMSKDEFAAMIHDAGTELWVPVPNSWLNESGHPIGSFAHVSRLADGRWVQIHAAPMPSGSYVTSISDISELKARDMRDLAIDLAERNALVHGDKFAFKEATVTFLPDGSDPSWHGPVEDVLNLGLDQRTAIRTYDDLAKRCRTNFTFYDLDELDRLIGGDLLSLIRQNWGDKHFVSVRRTTTADGTVMVRFVDVNDQFDLNGIVQESDSDRYRDLERVVDRLNGDIIDVTRRLHDENLIRRAVEQDLIASKEEAERSNVLTSRFVAAAGHDLMQPLNAARLFISTLVSSRISNRSKQVANKALRALDFASQLIEALLDLSKIELGLTKPRFDNFSVDDILRDIYAEFCSEAKAKGLYLRVDYFGKVVYSDRVLFRRIVQNFVANAIAHTTAGGVQITQRIFGDELRLAVSDTGAGIARHAQAEIFSEFTRIPTSDATPTHGLGLGLAIAAGAARLVGGRIRLASRPNVGSRFSLSVPMAPASLATDPMAKGGEHTANKIVIVIEDHDLTRDAMEGLLQSWGYSVFHSVNCDNALRIVQNGIRPDLIISDYHLGSPEVGTTAVYRLREALGACIPALIITADRSVELRQTIEREGMSFILKPLAPEALRDVLAGIWK
jgi:signal transduction histidine kinase